METGTILFCCVDSIEARRLVWDAVRNRADFFVDGRMSAEVLRVLTACDPASRKHYPATLFAAEEAYVGACTAKTTIYCANIAAGLMLAQLAKWLRRLPIDPDLNLNLLTSEMACPPEP
jgi:sulfur carrier protein ThiS adenylyltransferase